MARTPAITYNHLSLAFLFGNYTLSLDVLAGSYLAFGGNLPILNLLRETPNLIDRAN